MKNERRNPNRTTLISLILLIMALMSVSFAYAAEGNIDTVANGFNVPRPIVFDTAGNIYVGNWASSGVEKIEPDGTITLVSSMARPSGLAFDSQGNLYITSSNGIVDKIDLITGNATLVAGTGQNTPTDGDGGPATSAFLNDPYGIDLDAADNLYIADTQNNRVRRVDAVTGNIETIVSIASPRDVFYDDNTDELFIASQSSQTVWKWKDGALTPVAGNGVPSFSGDGGLATDASIKSPYSVVRDCVGNLFLTDLFNQRVRKVDTNGIITTIGGTGVVGNSGDGGPAISANLNGPFHLTIFGPDVYFTDGGNGSVRVIQEVVDDACMVLDSDGDGVNDNVDAFPNSVNDPTVIIGGCDSGVSNHFFADGSYFGDLISEAQANAKNHGQFVKAVNKLTNQWKKDGLITGKEKGKINFCL